MLFNDVINFYESVFHLYNGDNLFHTVFIRIKFNKIVHVELPMKMSWGIAYTALLTILLFGIKIILSWLFLSHNRLFKQQRRSSENLEVVHFINSMHSYQGKCPFINVSLSVPGRERSLSLDMLTSGENYSIPVYFAVPNNLP